MTFENELETHNPVNQYVTAIKKICKKLLIVINGLSTIYNISDPPTVNELKGSNGSVSLCTRSDRECPWRQWNLSCPNDN